MSLGCNCIYVWENCESVCAVSVCFFEIFPLHVSPFIQWFGVDCDKERKTKKEFLVLNNFCNFCFKRKQIKVYLGTDWHQPSLVLSFYPPYWKIIVWLMSVFFFFPPCLQKPSVGLDEWEFFWRYTLKWMLGKGISRWGKWRDCLGVSQRKLNISEAKPPPLALFFLECFLILCWIKIWFDHEKNMKSLWGFFSFGFLRLCKSVRSELCSIIALKNSSNLLDKQW